ncbi:TniQ family protein [Micromonospora sp. FIMYZ51]|uniref:TniQ family protein n=1 Tax=Micromonospora sp. FIMYZ51 TaxID=3051832 RepID=UPI00311E9AB7
MTTTALRLPPLRRLPRALPPLLNETVRSYVSRLAAANALTGLELQVHLTGSVKKETVTADQLAMLTGYPARTLRYAMLELCTPADLARMQIAGRPRPGPTDWGWRWPHNRIRFACDHCTTRRGPARPQVWTTHEDVVCLRHRRWLGTLQQEDQPDLAHLPDILAANRRHRRLIQLHRREPVRSAVMAAAPICRGWSDRSGGGQPSHERLLVFQNQGDETRFIDNAAVDAASYPEIVALARLFASPYWRHQAMTDNLNPEPIADAVVSAIFEEIRTGRRHHLNIPEDIREAIAGVLRPGPALVRFTSEIQRTVNPHYEWHAWPHYNKFPPITQWIMDQIEAARDPDNHQLRRRQAPPEHFEPTADVPQPRRATVVRHVNPTGATSGAKS